MNLVSTNKSITMSSREIADLVKSRHDNVKRTIETLAEKGVIAFPQSEEKATAGRPVIEYKLCKREIKIRLAFLVQNLALLPDRSTGRSACPYCAP
jgi:phage regulator Rha-like protein